MVQGSLTWFIEISMIFFCLFLHGGRKGKRHYSLHIGASVFWENLQLRETLTLFASSEDAHPGENSSEE